MTWNDSSGGTVMSAAVNSGSEETVQAVVSALEGNLTTEEVSQENCAFNHVHRI